MNCEELRQGHDITCQAYQKKYVQQSVLVNKADVLEFAILRSQTDILGNYECRHHISFRLKEGKTGFRIMSPMGGSNIFATFSKSVKEGFPQYSHLVQVPVFGVDVQTKCFLKQLDFAHYFAAVQYMDGTVEVFGFENGLTTGEYTFDPQANMGGNLINLQSSPDEYENEIPFIYKSGTPGNETVDFDSDFAENPEIPSGDFNNDFNNDYFI